MDIVRMIIDLVLLVLLAVIGRLLHIMGSDNFVLNCFFFSAKVYK